MVICTGWHAIKILFTLTLACPFEDTVKDHRLPVNAPPILFQIWLPVTGCWRCSLALTSYMHSKRNYKSINNYIVISKYINSDVAFNSHQLSTPTSTQYRPQLGSAVCKYW